MPGRRKASHAGSWYTGDPEELSLQLNRWLDAVPQDVNAIGPVSASRSVVAAPPVPGARVIIAPHAGYTYSGRAAAWAYKSLDLNNVKRIFLLGPSHHHFFRKCALSQFDVYGTILGDLTLDKETITELNKSGLFDLMTSRVDEAEHSLEMHLPYIRQILARHFSDYAQHLPPLVPILVGNTSRDTEKQYGKLLAPFLADPTSIFVVSSDFAHWGQRFGYTYYEPSGAENAGYDLGSRDKAPSNPAIHESIAAVDLRCMGAVETGVHDKFLEVLEETGNTVCGRHPIGIVMAAMEEIEAARTVEDTVAPETRRFNFVRYERSSDCVSVRDSSVSYCSAYAVV